MRKFINVSGQICKVIKTAYQFNPEVAFLCEVEAPPGFLFSGGEKRLEVDTDQTLTDIQNTEHLVSEEGV